MNKVVISQEEGLRLVAHVPSGHALVLDGEPQFGGFCSAPRPMEVLLVALASCTAMDVISLLNRMRARYRRLKVEVEYVRAQEHPKVYTKTHLRFVVLGGVEEDRPKYEKAIRLSQDKYCPVTAHLKPTVPITWELVLAD